MMAFQEPFSPRAELSALILDESNVSNGVILKHKHVIPNCEIRKKKQVIDS
jgi:hypothetical protein